MADFAREIGADYSRRWPNCNACEGSTAPLREARNGGAGMAHSPSRSETRATKKRGADKPATNLKPGENIVTKGSLFIDRAATGS